MLVGPMGGKKKNMRKGEKRKKIVPLDGVREMPIFFISEARADLLF